MMNRLNKSLMHVFLIAVFMSCNKIELTPDQIGAVVFQVDLFDGNNSIQLEAGEMDYYMITDWQNDEEGVIEIFGTLKQINCDTACGPALSIYFRNRDDSNEDNFNIEEVISARNYTIYSNLPQFMNQTVLNMSAIPEGVPPFRYSWDLGDGTTLNEANITHVYQDQNKTYNVELEVSDAVDCTSTANRIINLNQQNTDCSFTLLLQDSTCLGLPNTSCVFAIPLSGIPPFSYSWSNGDSTEIVVLPTDSISMGAYCVTMTDGAGCTATNCINYSSDLAGSFGSTSFCTSRINLNYENVQIPVSVPQYGTVRIAYTSEQGIVYSTDYTQQEMANYFKINDVEAYLENENELPTQKIAIEFEVKLASEDGKEIVLKVTEGSFGIAYPKQK